MSRILTYGTFDLLHTGHINILKRAKEMGDYLIVGLSTDEFNAVKNKDAFLPFAQRKAVLEAIRFVDEVIAEESWDQKKQDIINYRVDKLVMGDDWMGKFDFLGELCEVVYLPRTKNISTTLLKEQIARKI